jgi:hypothetical protein
MGPVDYPGLITQKATPAILPLFGPQVGLVGNVRLLHSGADSK